jgi:hypothetical protein
MAPEYDWGSEKLKLLYPDTWMDELKKRGAMGDCSGKWWAVAFRCGKLYSRITSREMAQGKGGWKGKYVSYSKAPACAAAFFTFSKDRKDGHTGILREPTHQMENSLAHASQKFNKFMQSRMEEDTKNGFYMHLSGVVELD